MVITDIGQVTPAFLTRLLIEKGYAVVVEQVAVIKAQEAEISSIYHLLLRYKQNDPQLPTRLFLKLVKPQFGWEKREVDFYRRIVPVMTIKGETRLPFVHCYDTAHDEKTMQAHLLLEDLSETYFGIYSSQTPTRAHYEQVMDGFAKLHAFWWEHLTLGHEIGERLTERRIDQMIEAAQIKLAEVSNEREELMAVMQAVAAKWPAQRRERVVNGWGITLVHRDTHPRNFLYARHGYSVKIIDWQSWRVDTGTDDLAYMMACHWDWGQRAQMERDLLQRYHERLVEYGVRNYTMDDVLYDYQASIARCLFDLMLAWAPHQWKWIGRGVQAFEEWQCAEIL